MRYFIIALLAVALFTGISYGQAPVQNPDQEAAQPEVVKAKKYREVPVDRNGDVKIDGVDVYDNDNRIVRKGYDDNDDGGMERWEDYDPETGLPIRTPSDSRDEIR